VIIDQVKELILLGALLANPGRKGVIGVDLFSGELADIFNANGKQQEAMWEWLRLNGVERKGEEKFLEAIARTVRDDQARRRAVTEFRKMLYSIRPSEVGGSAEWKRMQDAVHAIRSPVPEKTDPKPPE